LLDGGDDVTQTGLRLLVLLAEEAIQGALRRVAGELLHQVALDIHDQCSGTGDAHAVGPREAADQQDQHQQGDDQVDDGAA